jgi:predicted PurR-regulated permease PerM
MKADPLRQPKLLVSTLFTVVILFAALWVLSPFILSLLWAAIIAIAFWPFHRWMNLRLTNRPVLAAVLSTFLVGVLLVGPMIGLLLFALFDIISFTNFLALADRVGVPPPVWLRKIPAIGFFLNERWLQYLAVPDQLSLVFRHTLLDQLGEVRSAAQSILADALERIVTLFFALWVLFFLFRDGPVLSNTVNRIGSDWLGRRWQPYTSHLPSAMRASVNGLVIVSFTEAVLLSSLYALCDVPGAVFLGTLTAILAFIPMAAPGILAIVALLLFTSGESGAAIALFSIGIVLVLLADYWVRPLLIQDGTHLPFLAVLFGVFGGVVTLGIVGLIIGPVILVLLDVFFDEAAHLEQIEMQSQQQSND